MAADSSDRRRFLKGAALGGAGAAAAAFPAPAISQGRIQWRMVTTWPKNFPGVGTAANRIAARISEMSDGRFEVKVFGAGEFVPAFEVFDTVRQGNAECGHDAPYYWMNKNRAAAIFCTVPGGLTPQEHAAWIYYGGGQELWDELYAEFGVRAWLAGNAGTQMVGWYRKEITGLDDLKGLKIRMAGLQSEVLNRLGATTVNMPGGEIMSALQSGVIDAAEWGGPWMDLAFGFYKVAKYCYGPGVHEPGAAQSLLVNNAAYDALPKDLQSIVRNAATAETALLPSEFRVMNMRSLAPLIEQHGAKFGILPDDILGEWFRVSQEVVAETAEDSPLNKRIYESWLTFRNQAMAFSPFAETGFSNARAT